MTPPAGRERLLRIARQAIVAQVTRIPAATDLPAADASFLRAAAFVTIHVRGELRGCIGQLEPACSLPLVISECAVAACTEDARFAPIAESELAELSIEVSLLGPLEPVSSSAEVEIGRHGLVIERGRRRGLLLPQVACEWGWDAETFLAQTCRKAGLPLDAWRSGARIWRFEAEVFGDTG